MTSQTTIPKYIYKILPSSPTPPSPLPETLPVSSLDARDNFIHASTSQQLLGTLRLFFAAEPSVILLRIPVANVRNAIVWEPPNEHGQGAKWNPASGEPRPHHFFPHLYNGLKLGRDEVDVVGTWTRDDEVWSSRGWPFGDEDVPPRNEGGD